LDQRADLYGEFIRGQQLQKQQLEQEIERLQPHLNDCGKISITKIYKTDLHQVYQDSILF